MFFNALGSLPLGTAPIPVVVAPPAPPSVGAGGGGSVWDDRFLRPLPVKEPRKLTEAELIAILLAANEEYFN